MQDSPDALPIVGDTVASNSSGETRWGWYLYGIIRNDQRAQEAVRSGASTASDDDEQPLEAIVSGELAAIVRGVPLAPFSAEALRARSEDPAWVETVARRHNAVVEAVHRAQTILPAQFGAVYPRADDVRVALQEEHETLLARLQWLRDCDEWGVRLYGDIATIRQRVATEQGSVQRLRQELSSASRGRAYFLQRQLADELANAAERLVDDLVSEAYDRFGQHAKAGQLNQRLASGRIHNDENSAELIRATFLVPRESANAFVESVTRYVESHPGVSCEYSGPWPPYSFAEPQEQRGEG